jgi:hypothetical protein
MSDTIHKIVKFVSVLSLILGIIGCTVFYFNKEAELGTLIYFYILFAGIVSMLSLFTVLLFCSYERSHRKKLITTIAILVFNFAILLIVSALVYS